MSRTYTRTQKAAVVAQVDATTLKATAKATGIRESTIRYWLNSGEFDDIRAKTRADIAEQSLVIAQLAAGEIVERIRSGNIDGRSLVMAFGVAVDKLQLLSGEATARTEVRDLSRDLSDEELRDALRDRWTRPGDDGAPAPTAGPATDEGLRALPG